MKPRPLMVATSLVKKLASADSEQRRGRSAPGRSAISTLPMRTLNGTLNSRGAAVLEAQHDHRQGLEDEAPDDAEGIGLAQQDHVAAADDDREQAAGRQSGTESDRWCRSADAA